MSFWGRVPEKGAGSGTEYTDLHYIELGSAIVDVFPEEGHRELIQLAKDYHNDPSKYPGQWDFLHAREASVERILEDTHSPRIYDRVTFHTSYFKKSIFLKKYVLEHVNGKAEEKKA